MNLNELSEKVKGISTNGLTKDFMDKFILLNGSKNITKFFLNIRNITKLFTYIS